MSDENQTDTGFEDQKDIFNEDNTSETNEDASEESQEDVGQDEEGDKVDKTSKSEIAQKIKYREKYLKAQDKVRELEDKLETKEQKGLDTSKDEKVLAAKKFIRDEARAEYEAMKAEEEAKEEKAIERFQEQLDAVCEDNPDFTEKQLVDTCEEYEVEPAIAAKILKKSLEKKPKKPSLPSSKRASIEVKNEKNIDDSKKSFFDIAREEKERLKT